MAPAEGARHKKYAAGIHEIFGKRKVIGQRIGIRGRRDAFQQIHTEHQNQCGTKANPDP